MQARQVLESASREIVFESESISVWCFPEQHLVYHQMHKHCYGTPFRDGLRAGTAALQRHHCTAWLSDNRLTGPLPDEDEQWATSTWFPQTKASGWKYWAMVLPDKAVGKLNVKRLVELYRKRGIEAQMVTSPELGLTWLEEISTTSA